MHNLAMEDPAGAWSSKQYSCDHDHPTCQARVGVDHPVTENATLAQMLSRLDALLLLLKDCKGRQCTHPWESYFPSGDVTSLAQALNPRYDAFFTEVVANVDFEECTKGYIPELEGPTWDRSQVCAIVDEVWIDK